MARTDIDARQESGSKSDRASEGAAGTGPNRWRIALLFALYLVVALVLQNATGVYRSELSHWPDEAAHATTSLLVRDYVTQGFPANPLAFAKNYYAHYPKVAIGMWPPFFYMVAGTWLLCFGATKVSLLVLEAVIVALLGTLMAVFGQRFAGWFGSIAAGLLFIALPCTQNLTSMCMVDVPVTLMQFSAMWLLVRFFHTGQTLDAALFGLVAALAMLTKANANSLALLPVALLILTRRYDLLKRPGLYVSALIAAVLGLPWQIVSLRMQQTSGSVAQVDANYILHSLAFYSRRFYIELGPILLALAVLGAFWSVIQFRNRTRGASMEAAGAVSLIVACLAFHSLLPTPPDERYLLSAIPAMILCALAGLHLLARTLHRWIPRIPTAAAAVMLGAGAVAACSFSIPVRPEMGFARVADYIDRNQPHGSVMLVCSDAEGEGAMVVEMALREKRPDRYVLRGTKMLSDNIWQTSHYKALLANPAEALAFLDRAGVGVVVMDRTKVIWEQDRNLLDRALASQPASWQQVSDFSTLGAARDIILYKHTGVPRAPTGSIVIPLRTTLGFDLEVSPKGSTDRK